MAETLTAEQKGSAHWLKMILHPGDRLWAIERYVSPKGTFGVYSLYRKAGGYDGDPVLLDWGVASLTGFKRAQRRNGIVVQGADSSASRVSHLVQELSNRLWPDGWACRGDCCPEPAHRALGRVLTDTHDSIFALRFTLL